MKRRAAWFILFLILAFTSSVCFAEDVSLEDEVDREIEEMDLGDFESFVNDLDSEFFGGMGVKQFVKELTKGNVDVSVENVVEKCFSYIIKGIVGAAPFFTSIILIAVLLSLVLGLTQNFQNKQTVDIVYFVCFAAVVGIVMTLLVKTVGEVKNVVNSLTNLVNGLFPVLLTLMTALGGNSTAAVFKPQIAVMCAAVINVVSAIVIPLFIVSVVLCVAGNLSSNVKLDKLLSTTRYVAKVVLSFTFGGFVTYLTIAGIVGGISDGVSVRAAKYLVSNYVPILGGYISQGFDLVAASLTLIKNALGITGILAVLAVTLTPVFKLIALTIGFKFTAGLIEPITDKRMSSFVNGISECTRALVGATLGVGFVFIATLMLVILTLNLVV